MTVIPLGTDQSEKVLASVEKYIASLSDELWKLNQTVSLVKHLDGCITHIIMPNTRLRSIATQNWHTKSITPTMQSVTFLSRLASLSRDTPTASPLP